VLQAIPKIKRVAGGSDWHTGSAVRPGPDGVFSKDVSSTFDRDGRDSAIAVSNAGRQHGPGRGGRRRRATEPRQRAKRNATGKADATGSASRTENDRQAKPFRTPRG